MADPPPSPPADDMPPEDVAPRPPSPPRRPAYLENPNDVDAFEAAVERVVNHQLVQRHQFLMGGDRYVPGALEANPDDLENVLSPQNSDDEEEAQNRQHRERVLEFRRNVGNFLDVNQIRREARQILREVQERDIEARREQQQQQQRGGQEPEEINNNGDFRDFNGILSPSPSPSPSASPVPMDDDEGEDQDPREQARPDDDEVNMLNDQMFGMQPHLSRPRKRHNSADADAIQRKRVTFKMDSSDDEAVNSIDDDLPDFSAERRLFRKGYDDDDEGFYGGPPARHNSFST